MYKTPKFTRSMCLMLAMVGLSLLLTAGLNTPVSAAPVDAPTAESHIEKHDETGVLILSVVPDSPADEAGITRGDIVLAVGDETINSVETFAGAIGALAAGDEIVITVLHGDDTLDLPTILGERDGRTYLGVVPHAEEAMSADEADTDETDADEATEDAVEDGAADEDTADEASSEDADAGDTEEDTEKDEVPAERRSLRSMIPFGQGGAMIAEVVEDSPAADAGLVAGDLIVAVDGVELGEDVDFAELIGSHGPGDEVTLTVTNIESNETLEVPVTLGAHPDDEERAFLGIAYMLPPALPGMGDVAPGDTDPDEDADSDDADLDNDEAMEEADEGDEDAGPTASRPRHSTMPFGQNGAMIAEVVEDGPADEAGLVAGDLIVAVDGQELGDDVNLAELIGAYTPGDEITLTVTNTESNEKMEIPVLLDAHPEDEERAYLGIAYMLAPASPGMDDVAPDNKDTDDEDTDVSEDDEGSVPDSRYNRSGMASVQGGAKVAEVVAGGAAAEAGLVAGDLIVAVDGEELSANTTLGDLIGGYAPGDEVVLTIQNRGSGETVDVTVTLDAHPDDAERAYLGIAYMPVLNRAGDSRDRRQNAYPAPSQRQEPQDEDSQDEELEDGDSCIHGHEGFHGGEEHHGSGEHGGMMMPYFHHGMEGFDFDQLSEEDREALEEMYPFLFPDVDSEGETEDENG